MTKLPNGYGGIKKLSGKRRRPYIIEVTIGWSDDKKQIRKTVGYAKTRKEALDMLAEYHHNPYDLDYRNVTFADTWKDVEKDLLKQIDEDKMSEKNYANLLQAYKNHLTEIHNDKLMDLKYQKLQYVIDNAKNLVNDEELGFSAKGFMKTVCVKVFNYAIDKYELPLLRNPAIRLECGVKTHSDKHKPFTKEELSILWGMQYNDIVKILLIFCYSGTRPNEIFKTHKDNIFLDENYFITGSKTEAGKDRKIPIHPKVKHLFEYFYYKESDYPFTSIVKDYNYGKFKRRFDKIMKELNFDHTPYDGRHTFATKMKKAHADGFILKRILGHSIKDVTEAVYTHRDIQDLYNEILKIK